MGVREQLADLFPHTNPSNGLVGLCNGPGGCWCGAERRLTEAVTRVERIATERAADELAAMADVFAADARHLAGGDAYDYAASDLRDRAAKLRIREATP